MVTRSPGAKAVSADMVAGAGAKDLVGARSELRAVDDALLDQEVRHAVEPPAVESGALVVLGRGLLDAAAELVKIEHALVPQHVEHRDHVLLPVKLGHLLARHLAGRQAADIADESFGHRCLVLMATRSI